MVMVGSAQQCGIFVQFDTGAMLVFPPKEKGRQLPSFLTLAWGQAQSE